MNSKNQYSLLPFETIKAATQGDVLAIKEVLELYSAYISKLAIRPAFDEVGNVHLYVDETMKRQLEIKLITKILKFDIH